MRDENTLEDTDCFIVVDNPRLSILVPTHVATCPDCGGYLEALPNDFETWGREGNTYKVSIPTIYCQNNDEHGEDFTGAWANTYDAVYEWVATLIIKFTFFYVN
jgi:hypothetical protein